MPASLLSLSTPMRAQNRRKLKPKLYTLSSLHPRRLQTNNASAQAIPRELQQSRRPKGAAIITDVDDGTGPTEDLPEASKEGVLDVARDEQGKPLADGADPESEEVPYSRTGWAPQLGWPEDDATAQDSLLDHATWVESQLPDTLYGGKYQCQL